MKFCIGIITVISILFVDALILSTNINSAKVTFKGDERIPSIWPLKKTKHARITAEYGKQMDSSTGKERFHKGIDIVAPSGTPVIATANGIVKEIDRSVTRGNLIVIDHGNGFLTRYLHLDEIVIEKSKKVSQREIIGYLGRKTIRTSGPDLHYEIRKNGRSVDPMDYIHNRPENEPIVNQP